MAEGKRTESEKISFDVKKNFMIPYHLQYTDTIVAYIVIWNRVVIDEIGRECVRNLRMCEKSIV